MGYSELNMLASSQSFKARTRDRTEESENVSARFLVDEPETVRFVQPRYGASSFIRNNLYLPDCI